VSHDTVIAANQVYTGKNPLGERIQMSTRSPTVPVHPDIGGAACSNIDENASPGDAAGRASG
jgi:hypothetical protein